MAATHEARSGRPQKNCGAAGGVAATVRSGTSARGAAACYPLGGVTVVGAFVTTAL